MGKEPGMNKFVLCNFLFAISFFVMLKLFSMPEATETPSEVPAQPTEMPSQMPAQTAETPGQPTAQPGQMPVQSATMPTQPGDAAPASQPAEEVKPEQLGEFKIDENQPEIMQDKDLNIRNLVNKSNELSKNINDTAKQISEIRDKAFNKFSEINNALDTFFQKVGFESGRVKELLKEQK
jgi:hypothetical protein